MRSDFASRSVFRRSLRIFCCCSLFGGGCFLRCFTERCTRQEITANAKDRVEELQLWANVVALTAKLFGPDEAHARQVAQVVRRRGCNERDVAVVGKRRCTHSKAVRPRRSQRATSRASGETEKRATKPKVREKWLAIFAPRMPGEVADKSLARFVC